MSSTGPTLEALYAAGHWLIEQDRPRQAISLFRTMLLVDPRDERGWLALATCHEKLDEPEKAIALCQLALDACDGKAVRCTIARARLHKARGERDDALAAYDEAARIAESLDDRDLTALIASEAVVS